MSESFDPYYKWLGIPPKDQPPNHYRLLGVDLLEEDVEVIEAAANRQMTYVQGCASGPHIALSQRLLNEIAQARLALLDPSRKKAYDQKLRAQLAVADVGQAEAATESGSTFFDATDDAASDLGTPVTMLKTLPGAYGGDSVSLEDESRPDVQEKRLRRAQRGPTRVSINWRFPVFIILAIVLIIGGIVVATKVPQWLKVQPPGSKPAGTAPRPR